MPNALMMATSLFALTAPYADRDDRATVARLDRVYQQAVKENDARTMARILHQDFRLVLGDGRKFGRNDLLRNARDRKFTYELQDEAAGTQHVVVAGDTAIVTAKLLLKATTADGQRIEQQLWFSDTYVRTDRGWRYLFGQASLPESDAPAQFQDAAL